MPDIRKIVAILLFFLLSAVLYSQSPAVKSYTNAELALTQGDYYTAIELYKSALNFNPHYFEALYGMAAAYYGIEGYDHALTYIKAAENLNRGHIPRMILHGRILLALNRIEEASRYFEQALEQQPNNTQALTGIAEVALFKGQVSQALMQYNEIKSSTSPNKRLFLSLLIIYDELNQNKNAELILQELLRAFPRDPLVRYYAARHLIYAGDFSQAEFQARSALNLNPGMPEAQLLLGRILIDQRQFHRAVDTLEPLVSGNTTDPMVWYHLGLAKTYDQGIVAAFPAFREAIRLQPDEEIIRVVLENFAISQLDMNHNLRTQLGEYHFSKARDYYTRNLTGKALREYRRGLLLAPFHKDGRLGFAKLQQDIGKYPRYVENLELLMEQGNTESAITDQLEIARENLADTVARQWDANQFTMERYRHTVLIAARQTAYYPRHQNAHQELNTYLAHALKGSEKVAPVLTDDNEMTFSDIFNKARLTDADYFMLTEFYETDRSVRIRADMYHGTTGSLITTFNIYRTGNERLYLAVDALSDGITGVLPVKGRIIKRDFNDALISLGSEDGIEPEQQLVIVRKNSAVLNQQGTSFFYPEDAKVGTFTVEGIDLLVSEGTINKAQFFDMINIGDEIIPAPSSSDTGVSEEENPLATTSLSTEQFREILRLPE